MEIRARSKGILFDTVGFNLSSDQTQFFNDKEESFDKVDPVTTVNEADISNWLMQGNSIRNLIFDNLSLSRSLKVRTEVKKPIVQDEYSKPGDIDILAFDPTDPIHAIAFECKRIKIKPSTFYTDQIGGLENAKYAVEQANALANKFTFSQVYLMLIIQVNGKDRKQFNQLFRGSTEDQRKRIYRIPLDEGIDSKVGVLFVEIIQVSDQSFEKNGYVGVSIGKFATTRNQSSELTNKLQRFFREK